MQGTTRPERQSLLLQFVTGTTRIPVNGFKDLQGPDEKRRGISQLRTQAIRANRRRVIHPLIVLTCHSYKDYARLEYKPTLAIESISLTGL